MIGEFTLKILCDKYGVSSEKIVNKNNNILTEGKYNEISETLNYLINDLKMDAKNIEKCPSILYRNVNVIKENFKFLKENKLSFSSIETCLHVLSTEPNDLRKIYTYVEENYGKKAIEKTTSILSSKKDLLIEVEKIGLNKNWNLSIAHNIDFGFTTLDEVKKIAESQEFKDHPKLFTSKVLACSNLKKIQDIIESQEFKAHPELFTSQVLAHSSLKEIQDIIGSQEFKDHPELFTSEVLARSSLEEIHNIIESQEFKAHPELFTSTTLAHASLKEIQDIIGSQEFKDYPELFTSTTLAYASLKDIQDIIKSQEFKDHPELFTSQVLARSCLKEIQDIIESQEFKDHPELFTSQVLAHSNLEKIQDIIKSQEFKAHPGLFTSEVLARSNIEDISKLLQLPYWEDERYKHLLTSSVLASAKKMITKVPILIRMAEYYQIDEHIKTTYLLSSPSQIFALISYLKDNNISLVINNKLNSLFGYQPSMLKKKFGIDLKELMKIYVFNEVDFLESTKDRGDVDAIR